MQKNTMYHLYADTSIDILENGLILINISTYIQDLVTGIILIIALYISEFWVRKT
jgi:ribose/xylose/arabinose/galactoside ABC-type transport system permease subunit